MTKLIEFKNREGETLRGLIDEAPGTMAVVFLHGFERTTIEPKFKNIVDRLKGKFTLFRFDFTGTGMSDGDFSVTTVEKLSSDLEAAIRALQSDQSEVKKIKFVTHSLGAVVATLYLRENPEKVEKILAMAPAYNQKELQRYWFVRSEMKKADPPVEISWDNYKDYLDENAFFEYCRSDRMSKAHLLQSAYSEEVAETDYQILLDEDVTRKLMIVQSVLDDKVPFHSNNQLPAEINLLKLEIGDHDLESPKAVEKYLDKVLEFIG
ncbi:MAG: alpha/beta hydrolase [Candidatus Berkelbacteria bacterium]|nr:alpha/beta hydrolase [Candidatus Berkelbacteria bacterium]